MASRKLEKQIWRELKRISENIPRELLKDLMKKETVAPTMKKLIEKAVLLPDGEMDMTPEKRERFQNMLDSGSLDRQVDVINKEAESAIDAYFEAEVAFAVKMGRLPKEAPIPAFLKKKGIKYARKQRASLEELFSAPEDPEGSSGGDEEEHARADSSLATDDRELSVSGGRSDGQEGVSESEATGGSA